MIVDGKKAEELLEFLRESNAIEGVYDQQSVDDALEAWSYLITKNKMTPYVVKQTHKILMKNQPLEEKYKGKWRDFEIYVGQRCGADPLAISGYMGVWCRVINHSLTIKYLDTERKKEWATQSLHVNYEIIHPFADGNGRTGRMFMNWQRLKMGLPLLIIHEGPEQMKYYTWFD